MICFRARIARKNQTYPNLTYEELVQLESWLIITADLAAEGYKRIRTERALKWKEKIRQINSMDSGPTV